MLVFKVFAGAKHQGYFILKFWSVWYNRARLKKNHIYSREPNRNFRSLCQTRGPASQSAGQRHTLPLCLALFTLAIWQ